MQYIIGGDPKVQTVVGLSPESQRYSLDQSQDSAVRPWYYDPDQSQNGGVLADIKMVGSGPKGSDGAD